MEVTLYNFSKRHNSTKQPTGGITKNLVLKDVCSKTNPQFFINGDFLYTYVKAWEMYYFIDEYKYDINGACYIICSLDVLATFKHSILETSAFVTYSTSKYSTNIQDSRVASECTLKRDITVEESIFLGSHSGGSYIITTASDIYGIQSWALDLTGYTNILNALISAGKSLWGSLQQLFGDAIGGFISCRYVPLPHSLFYSAEGSNVRIGDFDTGQLGYHTDGYISETVSIEIPWRYSDFRRGSDFTKIYILLPFIGRVNLQPETLIGANSITVRMVCNVATGSIAYGLTVEGTKIGTYTGDFGRPIPITANQLDVNGAITGLLVQGGAVLGGALATTPAGAVSSAAALISGVVKSNMSLHKEDFTVLGGFSGGYGESIVPQYELDVYSLDSRTNPSELTELYGRPCSKVLPLSSLTGYVETIGFSVDVDTLDSIRTQINQMVDSGIYIE